MRTSDIGNVDSWYCREATLMVFSIKDGSFWAEWLPCQTGGEYSFFGLGELKSKNQNAGGSCSVSILSSCYYWRLLAALYVNLVPGVLWILI